MKRRILALDLGGKRIGLALSDKTQTIARGLGVHTRRSLEEDLNHIKTLIQQEDVERVILGLPINMNGSLGPKAHEALKFKEALTKAVKIPVETFDERLTTAEAERVLIEANLRRGRRKTLRDQLAAVLILQGYLDRRKRSASASVS